jgi:uncharacterized cupin superfamily protein
VGVHEAPIDGGEHGRAPAGPGWFVLNVGEVAGMRNGRAGIWTMFEPPDAEFEDYGINIHVIQPGQANAVYHAEANQEDFLVLSGECVAVVEEQERRLKQWDLLHCPRGTRHILIGAGESPCAVLMVGARRPDAATEYPVSEVAGRHGAAARETTTSGREAYAGFPDNEPAKFPWPPT